MKEGAIIITLACKLEEVVSMLGSLIIKAHYDVAIIGTNAYLGVVDSIFLLFVIDTCCAEDGLEIQLAHTDASRIKAKDAQ